MDQIRVFISEQTFLLFLTNCLTKFVLNTASWHKNFKRIEQISIFSGDKNHEWNKTSFVVFCAVEVAPHLICPEKTQTK